MRTLALVIACVAFAVPAAAQLATRYVGVERSGGKATPLTTVYAIDATRVALVFKGARSYRMLFLPAEGVMRFVDDTDRMVMDLPGGLVGGVEGMLSKALGDMPAEQREQIMGLVKDQKGAMPGIGSVSKPKVEFVWTKAQKKVMGYDCTQVEVLTNNKKTSEYWGSPAADFKLSPAESTTVKAMYAFLGSGGPMLREGGGAAAFQWDATVAGYPLITRCFSDTVITLELTLESFDRKRLDEALFKVPKGYKTE